MRPKTMLLILFGNFVEKFYKRFFLDPNQPTIIFLLRYAK